MSKTLYVDFRNNGFWVYDVVSSVFLNFLIDSANDAAGGNRAHWLTEPVKRWRVNIATADYGFYLNDGWTPSQIDAVIGICRNAIATIRDLGEIPTTGVESWAVFGDEGISTRGHDTIPCEPILRFGDAIIALLDDRLPEPPAGHWWFFGLDEDVDTIAMRGDA